MGTKRSFYFMLKTQDREDLSRKMNKFITKVTFEILVMTSKGRDIRLLTTTKMRNKLQSIHKGT